METLPEYISQEICDVDKCLHDIYLPKLRERITLHILTANLKMNFFNVSDFFLLHKVSNDNTKKMLFQTIIQELKERSFIVATAFNKTSIILARNNEEMNENIWKTTIDFQIL